MIDFDTILITWDEGEEPPPDRVAEIEKQVRDDASRNLDGLSKITDLLFHHVFLGGDIHDGPCVFVHSNKGSNPLHCAYMLKPDWVSSKVGVER